MQVGSFIGQEKLKAGIIQLIQAGKFPHFSILTGSQGGGKKALCEFIAEQLNAHLYQLPDIKVDTVRNMIDDAYTIGDLTVYAVCDADGMSVNAKNAMLKIVEEPPRNAYFIMTLQDINNTLATIKSRGMVFELDAYTQDELYQFAKGYTNGALHDDEWELMSVCETPGDIISMCGEQKFIRDFYDYVELVVDNIAEVEPANAFKSAGKLALKTEDGYDLGLFFKVFIRICMNKYKAEKLSNYLQAIKVTSEYLTKLKTGVNKQQLYDMWVFDIRVALWT